MEDNAEPAEDQPAPSYGLLHITRAYNRAEINFEDWLRLSREWAERIIRQQNRVNIKAVSRRAEEER